MSTGVGMSNCCLSGSVHDGTPTGKVETIDNLQTYIAAPKDGSKAKSIVFLVDIFGWEFKNVRLLADNYAKAGFYCYIPDIHEGDSLPLEFLNSVEPPLKTREQQGVIDKTKATATVGTTLPPWLLKHREAVSKPLVDSFISSVRQIPGTQKVGAIGFCWGGRYAILAAHGNVDAAYACHPSLVAVPGDFEPVTKPLSLAVGDHDSLLDNNTVGQIQDLMAKKMELPHELRIYEGQIHGFALRSDWSSEGDRRAMDQAEKQGIEWFNKYLS
ncbi:dienelactone hydrolase family protein-like protein [Amylocarpus encephaloides]|uniref:Dienelactone hydrolase family protein-like protein n=1 Tax=Amylocarpus encephaloides TaxID=45428 RepID=A0A9P8C8N3_9HELO|nr:dienelactone hydrolase family protein-like protein [Amylocarpus encephaloides]